MIIIIIVLFDSQIHVGIRNC